MISDWLLLFTWMKNFVLFRLFATGSVIFPLSAMIFWFPCIITWSHSKPWSTRIWHWRVTELPRTAGTTVIWLVEAASEVKLNRHRTIAMESILCNWNKKNHHEKLIKICNVLCFYQLFPVVFFFCVFGCVWLVFLVCLRAFYFL